MADREFDVALFGATSVTGRRVGAYLADRAPALGLTWAAAGRDAGRVRSVLAGEGVDEATVLEADVSQPESLRYMAARARVVLNLVGPYTLHGRPVIEACVSAGTHYLDLTGEMPFARRTIDEFHEPAAAAGVKVVQACGFEALPPDLSLAVAIEKARRRWDEDPVAGDVIVTIKRQPRGLPRLSDFVSGGTMQSLAEAAGDPQAALIADPAALVTDPARAAAVRRTSPIRLAPRRREGEVIAPMAPAAFINPAVIHRTAALAEPPLAPFTYREGVTVPGPRAALPLRLAGAGALASVQATIPGAVRLRAKTRKRLSGGLRRILPDSGFGPGADRLEDWRWEVEAEVRTTGGHRAGVTAAADGHPGYLTTARMLGEAGLLLAEPEIAPDRAGCLTPAIAIGTGATERFAAAGLHFQPPRELPDSG